MTLLDLVAGDIVFIDANIFVYHFAPDPLRGGLCGQLLQRVQNREIVGYTSAATLSEVSHRLMTVEARARYGWTAGKVLLRLKQNPQAVQSLSASHTALANILQSGMRVLSVDSALVVAAVGVSQQTGLLSNDALAVAIMQAHGLTKIASQDADFDRVPGITRYAPV